ncbi:ankyrin repeats (3 copies) domain-containing protein [Ditylenchus destructor]|uniref:phospholipase A2 n=1 Tax=Ditylenchus destructor TaxID=166010 RepID=A0AAD4NDL2_9BILA|nr:ankyrin repeats (3 copies) domain-containing protein [Ditylenchus destructor]
MDSITTNLDDNIFSEVAGKIHQGEEMTIETPPDEEVCDTPCSSPTTNKTDKAPGLFSLAQVSLKINELWSTAREKLYGEDYWIPVDQYEVAFFPSELLPAHKFIYPPSSNDSRPDLTVVQGSLKNEPTKCLHHVVYAYSTDQGNQESLTIYRSYDVEDALDFCRRCEECRALFNLLDKKKDVRKAIRDITNKFQLHPLWRMVHIAIACARTDVFTDDGLNYLKSIGYSVDDLVNTVSSPEGQTPLMYAIQANQLSIVRFLLKIGVDPSARDMCGNNAFHYAALASVSMLEALWEVEAARPLVNLMNNDGYTPVLLTIRYANPRCLNSLLGFGAELNFRVQGAKNPLFEAVQSKSKSIEVIRALLEASPNLLNHIDEATGNTVIHNALYKTPLMGVLFLKHKEMNLNAKNKAGLTALHQYTTRGDIGMIVTLASYNCDLNVVNDSGNTALHLAVSKRFLHITRLLLCLGADPNISNEHGDTPRHLAALLNENQLVRSLVICGAKRCPPSKTGCVSGCVNEKSVQFLSARSSSKPNMSDSTRLTSPRSVSLIEEVENRSACQPKDKEYRFNRIQDAEHNAIYDEMMSKLTEMAERKERNSNIINVLTLDGGGIRGLVIIQILIAVEKIMGKEIIKYFDWVGGTSTGSLIAAGLSIGQTLPQLQMVYLRFKDLIFEGWSRPYNSVVLESFIQAEMGEKTLFSDVKWPRLLFTTTRADCFPVQLELMRNYRLPLSDEENNELGFNDPKDILLWKALRRSSAAPTYFSCVDNKYIDGGICANNPTLDLLTEIQLWNTVNKHMKLPNNVEIGCVLSIGTGVIPTLPMDPNNLDITANPYTAAVAIKNLGVILVDQVTATEGAPVNRASSWCITHRTPYFRLSAPLFKEIAMDTKDDLDLARMMWDCVEYNYMHEDYIKKLCALIKKIGESWTRRHLFRSPDSTHVDMETQTSAPSSPCSSPRSPQLS